LVSEHGEVYGYQICQLVKTMTNEKISLTEGALYPILHKLELKGILEVELRLVDNRIRKYYKLTKTGKSSVENKMEEMQEFLTQMSLIFKPLNTKLT
jgi:PadR family transcriptional regulator, regulatory protein PadR